MGIRLGAKEPEYLVVPLTAGVGFSAILHNEDGDFPAGTVIKVLIGESPVTTWTATITGPDAIFNESAAAVDAVLATQPRGAKLLYSEPPLGFIPWALGEVKIYA